MHPRTPQCTAVLQRNPQRCQCTGSQSLLPKCVIHSREPEAGSLLVTADCTPAGFLPCNSSHTSTSTLTLFSCCDATSQYGMSTLQAAVHDRCATSLCKNCARACCVSHGVVGHRLTIMSQSCSSVCLPSGPYRNAQGSVLRQNTTLPCTYLASSRVPKSHPYKAQSCHHNTYTLAQGNHASAMGGAMCIACVRRHNSTNTPYT